MLKDLIKSKKFENENWEIYFEDEHLARLFSLKNGKRNGLYVSFFPTDRSINYIRHYKDNIENGIRISCYSNTNDYVIFQIKNERIHGVYISESIQFYKNDIQIFSFPK